MHRDEKDYDILTELRLLFSPQCRHSSYSTNHLCGRSGRRFFFNVQLKGVRNYFYSPNMYANRKRLHLLSFLKYKNCIQKSFKKIIIFSLIEQFNPNKAGGGGALCPPPPLHDFCDCSRTHMDGASPLADFFL